VLIWTASITAGVVALAAVGLFLVYRHLNGNIQQRDVSGLLGSQPVDLHPQAENILVIGSDSRFGTSGQYGHNLVTDQSDTMMVVHIAANRQWAEVMSIPRDSYVNIPACEMGNGQMSGPRQFKINEAFALGNLDGNHTALGVACSIKTVEQDTGIYIDHFVVVNFTGFQNMVSALGGVEECNTQPINDPKSGLKLTAGQHLLNPTQALAYVRARYTLGDGSDLERIMRQQAFMSSLIQRVKSKLLNPVAIYNFLDAATKSLTIDTQLGGATGLYNLASSLRSLPSNKVAFFTLPTYPRSEVVPTDTANVLWTQPEDSRIFTSFRNDVPASTSLFPASASATPSASGPATPSASVTPSPSPDASSSGVTGSSGTASGPVSGTASGSASASATGRPTVTPSLPIASARTANQNICTG
jgi:LCP family protein required for cell wall assembly